MFSTALVMIILLIIVLDDYDWSKR